ncbi:hypothetical protein CL634_02450 [bacterium]|nr:hypothetical protein [bacterium]
MYSFCLPTEKSQSGIRTSGRRHPHKFFQNWGPSAPFLNIQIKARPKGRAERINIHPPQLGERRGIMQASGCFIKIRWQAV